MDVEWLDVELQRVAEEDDFEVEVVEEE